MQREDLSEKTALVTGGSRGIGLHIARALLNAGARVLITGRTERTLKSAVEDLGAGAFPYVCDQRYPESVRSFARKSRSNTARSISSSTTPASCTTPR